MSFYRSAVTVTVNMVSTVTVRFRFRVSVRIRVRLKLSIKQVTRDFNVGKKISDRKSEFWVWESL